MGKEILVAGGTGLIGANLTFRLMQMGLPVMPTKFKNSDKIFKDFAQYDFRQFSDCLEATKNKSTVVICAAMSYGAKMNQENPTSFILPNLKILSGLMEACAQNNVKTIILISSSTVYQPFFSPIREDELDLNLSPFPSYLGVGWLYRYMEQLASLYTITYGMKIIVFRPTSLYGPYDKFEDDVAHVIPGLIKKALRKDDPLEIWGSPNVVRDFLYIQDFIDDIVYSLTHDDIPANSPINVCSGSPLTILEAAGIIVQVCGYKPEIVWNAHKPSAIPYRTIDDTKYQCYFEKSKRTSFADGVQKSVDWYQQQK